MGISHESTPEHEPPRSFTATHWSVVLTAGEKESLQAVSNCAIAGCYAAGVDVASQGGGAIALLGSANLTIVASTLSSNTTPYYGGGIYLFNGPNVSLVNSTVSGNRTLDGSSDDAFGGGIFAGNGSTLNVTNSTIAHNSSVSAGGGIYKGPSGTVTVGNSLVAGNSASDGPDCEGSFVSAGYNLIGNTSGSTGFGSTGDQLNLNAQFAGRQRRPDIDSCAAGRESRD